MQKVKLYDTLSRKIKILEQLNEGKFGFYCCGPTVYGPSHIGNFRTFIFQDVLRRTLEIAGYKLLQVRNITNVDDKTILGAKKAGLKLAEFTQKWELFFQNECKKLQLLKPHIEPGAVQHINQQIELIKKILAKNHAYIGKDGSVYFSINSFKNYGKLSKLELRQLSTQTGNRSHGGAANLNKLSDEYQKEEAGDFALWKARCNEDGEVFWPSPWGDGRPGWHIECSAMSSHYLGENFALHSGGVDLIFPHHENEIAQSEAATGKSFVRHWQHINHLQVEGEKMSKSLGNLYTLKDIKKQGFSPVELHFTMLGGHYRHPFNFTFQGLKNARLALQKILNIANELGIEKLNYNKIISENISDFALFEPAWQALKNDLNTPAALGFIFKIIKEKNQLKNNLTKNKLAFEAILCALGINIFAFRQEVEKKESEKIPREIHQLAEERFLAKKQKNWQKADEIRQQINSQGWQIQDTKDSYKILRKL